VSLGEDVVYITGNFLVLYRKSPECMPRMRISRPDAALKGITSITTAPDHSCVASIEEHDGSQRITFWDTNLKPVRQPITGKIKVIYTGVLYTLAKRNAEYPAVQYHLRASRTA
jgi:hypothetical protein